MIMAKDAEKVVDVVRAMRLFDEKVAKLEHSAFTAAAEAQGVGWHGRQTDLGWMTETRSPDDESVESFALTYRFFVQNNEDSSLPNMAEMYRGLGPVSSLPHGIVQDFLTKVDEFYDRLNSPSDIQFGAPERPSYRVPRGVLFDVFMYGGLAHANPKKK